MPSFELALTAIRTQDPAGAWDALAETCERGAVGISVRRDGAFFEREIRQLGELIAWRDARVTEQRSLEAAGPVTIHVASSREAADAYVIEVLGAATAHWGYRPAPGEPVGVRAHFLEQQRLLAAGDAAAIAAYRRRHTQPILSFDAGRMDVDDPPTADDFLHAAVGLRGSAAMFQLVLDQRPTQVAISGALQVDLGDDVARTLLARLEDVDAELMRDTLLAFAVREQRHALVDGLLARKANPNRVFDGFFQRFQVAPGDGNGPLVNAVRLGAADLVARLLAAGGDPLGSTHRGRRVIDLARELGDPRVIQLLEAGLGTVPRPADLRTALAAEDVAQVLALLPTAGSAEAIQHAAQDGKTTLLAAVLAAPVTHDRGALAKGLWFAAFNGHLAAVQALLAAGADPNAYLDDQHGRKPRTARLVSQSNGHVAVAQAVKAAGGRLRP